MLVFFMKNRHGSITVMLSIILIAALSLNSTLLEIARFRGVERLYKEIGENAAFSVLAHYDRDLYENFGFLAVEQGIGNDEYRAYLEQNLTGLNSGMTMNGADLLGNVTDVDLQRIYPLSEKDVYVSQMMEFGAYRAPASLVNNALNLEDTLNELMENLEDALPILEVFKEATGLFEAYINVVISLSEYTFSVKDVKEAAEDYTNKLESYNSAVEALNDLIAEYETVWSDDESEDSENQDEGSKKSREEYEREINELRKAARTQAEELQASIENLDEVLEEHLEKLKAYEESYDQFTGMNIEALLSAAKQKAGEMNSAEMGDTVKNWIGMMEDNIAEGKGLFSQAKNMTRSFSEAHIEAAREKLKGQVEKIKGFSEDFETLEVVQEVDPTVGVFLTVIGSMLALLGMLEEMFEGLLKTIETIVKGAEALVYASTLGICDPDMNHTIGGERKLTGMQNPYEASDEAMVSAKLADSEQIAKSVNYDVSLLSPGRSEDAGVLENAMNNLKNAEEELRDACSNLNAPGSIFNLFNVVSTLQSLMELARAIGNFLGCLVDLINAFLGMSLDQILAIAYQKLFAAVYATEMFSNRVTDTNGDSRLNGSVFFDEGDYQDPSQCFAQADAEYIFIGNDNELVNQTGTFFSMLMLRILGNVTAVLTDSELMSLVSELAAVPIIGWIAAIVIIIVKLFLEAWYDMIFMIYAKEDVEIVKLNGGYFSLSGDGVDDLLDKIKKLIEEQTGISIQSGGNDLVSIDGNSVQMDGVIPVNLNSVQMNDVTPINLNNVQMNDVTLINLNSPQMDEEEKVSLEKENEEEDKKKVNLEKDNDKSDKDKSDNDKSDKDKPDNDKSDKDKSDKDKDKLVDTSGYVDGLLEWGYQDHLFLLILLFTSRANIYDRSATLIETQLRQKKAKDGAAYVFNLDEMATFIRVETTAEYQPLLPIPSIPGLNDKGIPIRTMHYSGY